MPPSPLSHPDPSLGTVPDEQVSCADEVAAEPGVWSISSYFALPREALIGARKTMDFFQWIFTPS